MIQLEKDLYRKTTEFDVIKNKLNESLVSCREDIKTYKNENEGIRLSLQGKELEIGELHHKLADLIHDMKCSKRKN